MMRSLKISIAAAAAIAAAPVLAQGIPVHDAVQYLQIVQQVSNSGTQIEKAVTQIQQLETTYNSLSKITNAASVASVLNNSAVRNLLPPEAASMTSLLSGNTTSTGSIGTLARQFQQQYAMPTTGTAASGSVNDAYSNYLNAVNGGAATSLAVGSNTLAIASQRTNGLSDLQAQISTAKDPKDAMDLNVRATVENAQATNDLMKLQALQLSQRAQSDMLLKQYWASRSRAGNAAEYDAVAALTAR